MLLLFFAHPSPGNWHLAILLLLLLLLPFIASHCVPPLLYWSQIHWRIIEIHSCSPRYSPGEKNWICTVDNFRPSWDDLRRFLGHRGVTQSEDDDGRPEAAALEQFEGTELFCDLHFDWFLALLLSSQFHGRSSVDRFTCDCWTLHRPLSQSRPWHNGVVINTQCKSFTRNSSSQPRKLQSRSPAR